ncbi:(4Fe-4S)-binding protein [Chitinophaga lutea]
MQYKLAKPVFGAIGTEKYQITIEWRNGTFLADEPVSSGGKDLGPDPYTQLIASLASCTLATLRMYIDRKGWDIPRIAVKANFYQQKENDKQVTIFDRDIDFISPVTDEQRSRLLDIAKACPVSRILEGEIRMRTFIYNAEDTEKKKHYTNGEVTVVWKPDFCKHSTRCVSQLPGVFNFDARPWINMEGGTTAEIIAQVDRCPSGALTWYYNKDGPSDT